MSYSPVKARRLKSSTLDSALSGRTALQAVSDGVVMTNARGEIEFLNPAAEALCGWSQQDALARPLEEVIALQHGVEAGEMIETGIWNEPKLVSQSLGDCTLIAKDGVCRTINANRAPVVDRCGEVTGTVLLLQDTSVNKELRDQLTYRSSHDELTGLLNRTAFEQAVIECSKTRSLRAHDKNHSLADVEHALLYIDLDQFKILNDTCGHAAGDCYLKLIAELLQTHERKNDVLARLGGDEFGMLLHGCSIEHAGALASEICDAVAKASFVWEGVIHRQTVSIGVVALKPKERLANVMGAADIACFTAKDHGRSRFHIYQDGEVPSRHVEMQWVSRVSRALEEDRLTVYQQPIVPIGVDAANQPAHFELLVRLIDRMGRIILPNDFIATAERYNLMPSIDRWMVSNVLERLVWREEFSGDIPMYKLSLNLSGTSLSDPGFMEFLESALTDAPIPKGALCFEITETATISNLDQVATFMHRIKQLGCEFSLDDFGSGLSSFAYLKELPVDLVKIDGDFVADLLNSEADSAVVESIARVAQTMGIKTIAECVENRDLLNALHALGVDYAQGYLIAEPQAVEDRSSFAGTCKDLIGTLRDVPEQLAFPA